jgi:Sigma-70, region 4
MDIPYRQERLSDAAPAQPFRAHRRVSIDELPPGSELADDSPQPEVLALDSELQAVLDRVIAELSPAYRAVVVLRDLEQLSTEETAPLLELGTEVVKQRLHRGRAAMRQKARWLPAQSVPGGSAEPESHVAHAGGAGTTDVDMANRLHAGVTTVTEHFSACG